MEKKKETAINNNGSYTIKEKITQSPEDGFIPDSIMEPTNLNSYRKFHKGYKTTTSFTTNDPRVTRPFAYGICGFFLVIGIFQLFSRDYSMAIPFILFSLCGFVIAKKDIDKIAKELKKKGYDVTIDSKEEIEDISKEMIEKMGTNFEVSKKNTFKKEHYNVFFKISIPIYSIIVILTTLLIAIFTNFIFALILFLAEILLGILYYKIVKKICKY